MNMKNLVLLLTYCHLAWNQTLTIRTLAGSNAVAQSVAAQTAALASTEGIAIDGFGNTYVSDAPDHRVRKIEPTGKITTVAGNGRPGSAGDDGPATMAQLNTPYGLAVDLEGNLYVADLGNARVRRISTAGIISTVAGGGNTDVSLFGTSTKGTEARLNAPRNLVVDAAGQVYISDFGAHRVYRLSADGQLTHLVGSNEPGGSAENARALTASLRSPTALALDKAGLLYIADSGNNDLRRVQRGLLERVMSTAGLTPRIKFGTITGLAIDAASGDLYVAEGRESPVRRVTPEGAVFSFAYGARDVAVDATGAVWFADGPFVRKSSRLGSEIVAGTGSFQFGGDGGPAFEARLQSPGGVATDKAGNIYISDTANHRVRRIGLNGQIETIAGTGEAGYAGNLKLAILAKLRSPTGLVVDRNGNVYVSDTGNHVVRRIRNTGIIETVAGTGVAGTGVVGTGNNIVVAQLAPLNGPRGLALDWEDLLTIADTENHRVLKVTGSGLLNLVAGRGTPGNTGDGALARIATLQRPTDLGYDAKGALFITDSGNRRVRWVSPQGTMMGFPSEGLIEPVALAWSGDNFYLADAGRHRVFLVAPNGARGDIGGTGEAGYSGDDGPAASALLNRPISLAVTPKGELLIADQENHRIRAVARQVEASGLVAQPGITAVVSAATLRTAPAVPGSLLTLFGAGLGPIAGALGRVDLLGRWDTSVQGVEVRFDGFPAPLFYVSETQINLQVPRMVTGRARVTVTVTVGGTPRGTRVVEVAESAPALFVVENQQALAFNEDGGANVRNNPAEKGSVLSFFATGFGLWEIDLPDGTPAQVPLPKPRLPVTVWIGGQLTELLFARAAPGQVGVLQINVRMPTRVPPGTVGNLGVVLRVGEATSGSGPMVWIF